MMLLNLAVVLLVDASTLVEYRFDVLQVVV